MSYATENTMQWSDLKEVGNSHILKEETIRSKTYMMYKETKNFKFSIRFPRMVLPNEQLLSFETVYKKSGIKTAKNYYFSGIKCNSLMIREFQRSNSIKEKNISKKRGETSINIERSEDRSFYFVPYGMKKTGYLKITQNKKYKAYYNIEFIKQSPFFNNSQD